MSYADSDEVFEPVLRILRGALDFRGRARRTDGILYTILVSLAETAVGFALGTILSPGDGFPAISWLGLVLRLPLIGWFVRRVHDYGYPGWVVLPFVAWMTIFSDSVAPIMGIDLHELRHHLVFQVGSGLVAIAFLLAIFWKPNEGTNRFGPNPRFDDPMARSIGDKA
jgi:uncharacterized membrane protein YhaH (DUF805 family)